MSVPISPAGVQSLLDNVEAAADQYVPTYVPTDQLSSEAQATLAYAEGMTGLHVTLSTTPQVP